MSMCTLHRACMLLLFLLTTVATRRCWSSPLGAHRLVCTAAARCVSRRCTLPLSLQVSQHSSWSIAYYGRIAEAALSMCTSLGTYASAVPAAPAGHVSEAQVSEHSSWSIAYYGRIVEAALAAAGAPAGLVRFVTGYGDAGHALVTGGVDKVRCCSSCCCYTSP
jgi:hypothetical protein